MAGTAVRDRATNLAMVSAVADVTHPISMEIPQFDLTVPSGLCPA
jgi:hypothetical protein